MKTCNSKNDNFCHKIHVSMSISHFFYFLILFFIPLSKAFRQLIRPHKAISLHCNIFLFRVTDNLRLKFFLCFTHLSIIVFNSAKKPLLVYALHIKTMFMFTLGVKFQQNLSTKFCLVFTNNF